MWSYRPPGLGDGKQDRPVTCGYDLMWGLFAEAIRIQPRTERVRQRRSLLAEDRGPRACLDRVLALYCIPPKSAQLNVYTM